MKRTADEIIEIVTQIQKKTEELESMKSAKRRAENELKRFEDTGNAWIRVSYCRDQTWETPYFKDQNPSDRVKEAVLADIKEMNEKRFRAIKVLEDEIEELKISLESDDGY